MSTIRFLYLYCHFITNQFLFKFEAAHTHPAYRYKIFIIIVVIRKLLQEEQCVKGKLNDKKLFMGQLN